jgi:hypothetical protein
MKSTMIAAAAGGILMGLSACGGSTPPANSPTTDSTVGATAAAPAKHDCKGKNDCKGQGGCKTSANGCKGKNDCKGQGGCKTA